MRRATAMIAVLALSMPWTAVRAVNDFQKAPFDFLFGNHIDAHQETKLSVDKATNQPLKLFGRLYVFYTGATDPVSGLPIARHPRGLAMDGSFDERCDITVQCVVGWEIRGLPGAAKFVSHSGVNGDDHPVWLANRAEEASAPMPGMVIPQPGSYSHFHWITTASSDPRAGDVTVPCNQENAGALETTAVNEVCLGWFLQITARQRFAFEHGGEIIPIANGEDIRSHLNIVTNYKSVPTVTTTRP